MHVAPEEITTWPATQRPRPVPMSVADGSATLNTARLDFDGRLAIPGLPHTPTQRFKAKLDRDVVTFESYDTDSWPSVWIECAIDPDEGLRPKDYVIRLSEQTLEGWLLQTRVAYALSIADSFAVDSDDLGRVIEIKLEPARAEDRLLVQWAKLIRKLLFIKTIFGGPIAIPDTIEPDQVKTIELVFRGITEGEFSLRQEQMIFENILVSSINLAEPPFDRPGPFQGCLGSTLTLLDRQLDVGPVIVAVDKGQLADPGLVDIVRKGSQEYIDIPLEVLDNQVDYRFERYSNEEPDKRIGRLEQFKSELAENEPEALVELVSEPLQRNVSSEEALRIAIGWQIYIDLPDRFCPREPVLDAECWRVPIHLVYADKEGGPVGEVRIDIKSGEVVFHTPIEELRKKGLDLAGKRLQRA